MSDNPRTQAQSKLSNLRVRYLQIMGKDAPKKCDGTGNIEWINKEIDLLQSFINSVLEARKQFEIEAKRTMNWIPDWNGGFNG